MARLKQINGAFATAKVDSMEMLDIAIIANRSAAEICGGIQAKLERIAGTPWLTRKRTGADGMREWLEKANGIVVDSYNPKTGLVEWLEEKGVGFDVLRLSMAIGMSLECRSVKGWRFRCGNAKAVGLERFDTAAEAWAFATKEYDVATIGS